VVEQPKEWGEEGGRGPTLAMECEKWKLKHVTIVYDIYIYIYGGLGARKISHIRSVFLAEVAIDRL